MHALYMYMYLADKQVVVVKMSAVEPWRISAQRLDLDAHLDALACNLNRLVVCLNAGDHSYVQELQGKIIMSLRARRGFYIIIYQAYRYEKNG